MSLNMHLFRDEEVVDEPDFTISNTIKLGTGLKTVADFRAALRQCECSIGGWGNDILYQRAFTNSVSDTEIEVSLLKVTVAALGFVHGATRERIYDRAFTFGWELCSAEVGPQLRLQYSDQPTNEWLRIAMEPIDSYGTPSVFTVEHDGAKCLLGGCCGRPGSFWRAEDSWVFQRRW